MKQIPKLSSGFVAQRGLSLVELLIALVLGLLLLTGVINVFLSSKTSYGVQEANSQVQENARFALEFISRDVRMAGFGGCSNDMSVANTLDPATGTFSQIENGVEGFEGGVSTFPTEFGTVVSGTDAIVIHSMNTDGALNVTSHVPASATIHVDDTHSYVEGTVLVIVDANCSNMGIFMTTEANVGGNSQKGVHNKGLTVNGIKNCTMKLKGSFDCSNPANAVQGKYSPGSSLYSLSSKAYYIKENSDGVPSLYRLSFGGLLNNTTTNTEEEIVEGISDLTITYGVKDSSDNITYKKAGSVASTEWESVVVVRLVLESQSLTTVDNNPVTRTFTQTVDLRNRG
ncbi:PilW family protein [Hahella ganghwensis]|uniref:PilW family protein n=1 Tax=Hahella ganghwensis TaxID=286420 RepID=UPI00037D60F6|nr:PilW family protein [Hahella ganghwensis]